MTTGEERHHQRLVNIVGEFEGRRERHGPYCKMCIEDKNLDMWYDGRRQWTVVMEREHPGGSVNVYPNASTAAHQLMLRRRFSSPTPETSLGAAAAAAMPGG